MPYLKIVEEKEAVKPLSYAIFKDGKEFAYAVSIADARLIKIACEDWWLNKRPK